MEQELKFRVPFQHAGLIRRRLESTCTPDSAFPYSAVWSIYYDTPDFGLLREKIDGDCDKRKVRLRWYDGSGPVFMEIKYRFGASRDKLRIETSLSARHLAQCRLDAGDVTSPLALLRMAGGRLPPVLVPMMTIRFQRTRFADPVSGVRVSVDEQITAHAVNRCYFPGSRPDPLSFSVIEIKGQAARLPSSLRGILAVSGGRVSLSKYLECYRCLRGR